MFYGSTNGITRTPSFASDLEIVFFLLFLKIFCSFTGLHGDNFGVTLLLPRQTFICRVFII